MALFSTICNIVVCILSLVFYFCNIVVCKCKFSNCLFVYLKTIHLYTTIHCFFGELFMENKRKQEYKMIGLNIAYYRKLKGITQLKLAEKINISRTHMSNIEAPNMPTSISLETLFDIADALDVPVSNLVNFNH